MSFVFLLGSCAKDTSQPKEENNIVLESRSECPEVNTVGCTVTNETATFTYHGCPIQTWFVVTKCPNGITISNLVWTQNIMNNCTGTALHAELVTAFNSYNYFDEVAAIYDAIWSFLGQQAQTYVLNLEASKPITNYNCNGGTIPYAVNYVVSGCYSLCIQRESDGEGGFIYNLAEYKCGESCCKRSTPFCINANHTISYGKTTKESTGNCAPVVFTCPLGFDPPSSTQGCRPACNRT